MKKNVMPYPIERALEDVVFGRGLEPARACRLFLPVWQVEVKSTTTEGRPYELIDRYLERGIAEGALSTVADLARFFGLDEPVVDRAVRFLVAIEHLHVSDGRLTLTELGARSHRDQVSYRVTKEDRRKLYFDGFGSRPLSRRYYDAGTVTFLAGHEVGEHSRFLPLTTVTGFRREALAELAALPDRAHYNLPVRIDGPESLGEECVFLPVYVVRAVDSRGARLLVYSQAGDEADPDLGAIVERTVTIAAALDNEERGARPDEEERKILSWLEKKGVDGKPVRQRHGSWQVVLPSSAFAPGGSVQLNKLGSFELFDSALVHLWCEDEQVRTKALLSRLQAYLGPWLRGRARDVEGRISRIARQLGFDGLDVADVQEMAERAGNRTLVGKLQALTADEKDNSGAV
ncbi:hypothetical protein SAMN05421504_105592 [Amycolatopsis xylanica]|uniref:Uncharacterized protein n=1 Tax=Amycolatopsis xylanica TaxID=589385 RepID=A0A1H3K0S6_9PSEU|nr:hypothetical protein [Amycolatopsis xylanica]SDY45114.1 hypothetical protein SAMN05421504_105592 [Amycolatopsis xylanica]